MVARSRPRTARPAGRPVGADAARTRERIVQAAFAVINERGYAAATFQEIAERSGLSRPTLNYYFASREDLYRALLEQAHGVVTSCIQVAKQGEGTRDRLHDYIEAVVAVWHRDHAVVGFLATARLEAYRHPDLPSATVAATRGFLGELIAEAIDRRELPPHTEPATLVELLYAMLWGIGAYSLWRRRPIDVPAIAKQLQLLLGNGLLPSPHDDC